MMAAGKALRILVLLAFAAAGTPAWAAKVYKIRVDGLACPFCAYGIEKKLMAVPGVKSLGISINKGIVTVTMRKGATLSRDTASRAVKNAGFTMRSFR